MWLSEEEEAVPPPLVRAVAGPPHDSRDSSHGILTTLIVDGPGSVHVALMVLMSSSYTLPSSSSSSSEMWRSWNLSWKYSLAQVPLSDLVGEYSSSVSHCQRKALVSALGSSSAGSPPPCPSDQSLLVSSPRWSVDSKMEEPVVAHLRRGRPGTFEGKELAVVLPPLVSVPSSGHRLGHLHMRGEDGTLNERVDEKETGEEGIALALVGGVEVMLLFPLISSSFKSMQRMALGFSQWNFSIKSSACTWSAGSQLSWA
jgi:hypothetical protein